MARFKATTVIHTLLPIVGAIWFVRVVSGYESPDGLDVDAQEAAAAASERRRDFEGAMTLRSRILAYTEAKHGEANWRTRDARVALDDVQVLQTLPSDVLKRIDEARALEEVPRQYLVDVAPSEIEQNLGTRAAVYRQVFGPIHPRVAEISVMLGDVRCFDGRYCLALESYREAASAFEQTLGRQHPRYVIAAQRAAMLCASDQTPDEPVSARWLKECIEIRRTLRADRARTGEPDLIARSIHTACALFVEVGQVELAKRWLAQELKIVTESAGEHSLEAAALLATMAKANAENGRSLELFERACAIYQRHELAQSRDYANLLSARATKHEDFARFEEAKCLRLEALAIYRAAGSKSDIVNVLANLCLNACRRNDLEAAAKYSAEGAALCGNARAIDYGDRIHHFLACAYLHACAEEPPLTLQSYQQALDVAEGAVLGSRMFAPIAEVRLSRARWCFELGEADVAEWDALVALCTYYTVRGAEHPKTREALVLLRKILEKRHADGNTAVPLDYPLSESPGSLFESQASKRGIEVREGLTLDNQQTALAKLRWLISDEGCASAYGEHGPKVMFVQLTRAMDACLDLTQDPGVRLDMASAWTLGGVLQGFQGSFGNADKCFRVAQNVLSEAPPSNGVAAELLCSRSVIQWLAAKEEDAIELHRKSAELRRKIRDETKAAPPAALRLGGLLISAGFRDCFTWWETREVPTYVDLYGPDSKEVVLQVLVHSRGSTDPAAAYKTLTAAIERERGARGESELLAFLHNEAGVRRLSLGDPQGLEHLGECNTWAVRNGNQEVEAYSLANASSAFLAAKMFPHARAANQKARDVVEGNPGASTVTSTKVFLQAAEIAWKSGDRQEIEGFFARAISEIEASAYPEGYTLSRILYRRALYRSQSTSKEGAVPDLMRALDILYRVREPNDPLTRKCLHLLVDLLTNPRGRRPE